MPHAVHSLNASAPSPAAPSAASLSNLINSPQGDPLPPAAGPGVELPRDDAQGRGTLHARRAPRAHSRVHGTARWHHGTTGLRTKLPCPQHTVPHSAPSALSPGPRCPCSTLRLALCLCTQPPRASPAVCSSKALPLLNSSIIDIGAEPPGAGGWQRYYLHLSSFPSLSPPFPSRLKSREIRRRKAASGSALLLGTGGSTRAPLPHVPMSPSAGPSLSPSPPPSLSTSHFPSPSPSPFPFPSLSLSLSSSLSLSVSPSPSQAPPRAPHCHGDRTEPHGDVGIGRECAGHSRCLAPGKARRVIYLRPRGRGRRWGARTRTQVGSGDHSSQHLCGAQGWSIWVQLLRERGRGGLTHCARSWWH